MAKRPAAARAGISGHGRLKRSLVLRDFLAADLRVRRRDAERYLNDQETAEGALEALNANGYLNALRQAAPASAAPLLEQLDGEVRAAGQQAGFAPRYFQYLAILFAAHHFNRLFADPDALLADLIRFHRQEWDGRNLHRVADFGPDDLQQAAFWMATAAGKTHILHACLALLAQRRFPDGRGFDQVILITPSEALSRQHAEALRSAMRRPVFVYPDDGDGSRIADQSADTVIIIDINKLTESKQGEGVSLDTTVFADQRNLVFVDEGHKGQKSEESVWKRIQRNIAGVGHAQAYYRGLLIEFSATFGQVAEAEHAFDRYAKSVLYDYAYDRFHADLYGKDFDVRNLQGASGWNHHADVLATALTAYWRQLRAYRDAAAIAEIEARGLAVEQPLWVLLGLSVVGARGGDDADYRSDIIEVLLFLKRLFAEGGKAFLGDALRRLAGDDGQALLPKLVWEAVRTADPAALANHLLREVFGHQPGAVFVLRALKTSRGEVGLGLLLGDRVRYFGVVNIGDVDGLKKALEPHGLEVETDAFTPSLFADLERRDSTVNLLVGSRRFSEGWNNYRASSLTLLRLGSGEGPLIVQMFGRVVRFRGCGGDGKRLDNPPASIAPLQTAYVYGLRADYMSKFLENLRANGIESRLERVPTKILPDPPLSSLLHLSAQDPDRREFALSAVGGSGWQSSAESVGLSLAARVERIQMQRGTADATDKIELGEDIKDRFIALLPYLDFDGIAARLLEFRAANGWWNLTFDATGLREGLEHGPYTLEGSPRLVTIGARADLRRLESIAVTLLQRLLRSAWRRQQAQRIRYRIAPLHPASDLLPTEIEVRTIT
jgi:hypothetical protein